MTTSPDLFAPGALIRAYQIERRLGGGGQAVTWLARDPEGRLVVLKQLVLRRAETWKEIELFQREAAVLEAIDHPAIPRCLDHFELTHDGGVDFVLVQQWVDAPSLAELIGTTRLERDDILHIARALLDILDWLHRRVPPIVHRDLKPSNVLFGADRRVYLIDFGAVKTQLGGANTGESTIVGTHGYMPAEQLMGHAEPRSDLYALGATLIHLMSGRHPSTLPLDGLRLRFAEVVNLPAPLVAWLESLVAPDPGARPASARAARVSLDSAEAAAAAASSPAEVGRAAPEVALLPTTARKKPRYGVWVGLAALVVAGLLAKLGSEPAPVAQPAPPTTTVSETPRVAADAPFVALVAELDGNDTVDVAPRRAMLRKAEMGFPHSSVDLAVVLTSKADKPIVSLVANVFLEGFQQRTQLVWTLVGELNPPLEPGESRVITTQFTDVPSRLERVRWRLGEAVLSASPPAGEPTVFVPELPNGVSAEALGKQLTFRERKAVKMPSGEHHEGRLVSDIEVRVEDPAALRYLQMKPRCVGADGSVRNHGVADYGMQIYIDGRYPGEAPWSRAGDIRVYRALCFPDTTRVTWRIDELSLAPATPVP